jgi:hypothetical protein
MSDAKLAVLITDETAGAVARGETQRGVAVRASQPNRFVVRDCSISNRGEEGPRARGARKAWSGAQEPGAGVCQ